MKTLFNYQIVIFFISVFCTSQEQSRFTLLDSTYTGVKFNNKIKSTKDKNILLYANFYSGAGIGIADFNNDGLQDLFFAGNMVPDRLYFNTGSLTFEDVTQSSGIKMDDGWSAGVTVGDVNNDGHMDIYVSRELYDYNPEKRVNLLYINKGDGTFDEKAETYGLADSQRTRHATFFDYNKDGFLDIFLLTEPPNAGILSEYFGSELLKSDSHVRLLKNTGKNSFIDVTKEAGMHKSGYPNAACASDLNNDGWTDLYVTNDFQEPDFLFINNKDGTFTNIIDASLQHISNFGMGVDISDINNDGLLDIFVVDMVSEENFRLKSNMSGMNPEKFWRVVENGGHYQYMFNTLQMNNGHMTFSDIAQITGMASTDWSWSNIIADFDNDGLKDVYISNGLLHDIMNTDADKTVADYIDKTSYDWVRKHPDGGGITSIFDILDLEKAVNLVPSNPQPNYAYKNMGDLQFKKVMNEWGLYKESFSNGAAYADLDNDGDLDLVVNNVNSNAFIYRNNSEKFSSSNFLKIQLSDKKHSALFNTKISVFNKGEIQIVETANTRGIYSSSEPLVHFGLGAARRVDSIAVIWPNQKKTLLKNVATNQVIKLDMKKASEQAKTIKKEEVLFSKMIFDSLSIVLKHQENDFDDYKHQVLLPHKMSQFGPALTISDVNNDGADDIFLGGALGFSASLYLQDSDGNFSKSSENLWEEEKGYEDIDALFVDINGDGNKDIYVVSGGNEHPQNSLFYSDRVYINDGNGNFKKKSIFNKLKSSGSKVIAEDYDKDGDLDIFIGGRHIPHQYPLPASSTLLNNQNGELIDVTSTVAKELKDIGMVTDAIWADYDNDNDSDLIIVGEWMPITIFNNDKGSFSKVSLESLNNTVGWWFSIDKGDFDNDGDIDLIAGNLGLNYKYKTSKENPFDIYYNDFDKNGKGDIVLGYHNDSKHYPLRGFSCSSQQIPVLKEGIKKYDLFASLEIDQIYGKNNLENSLHYKADTFASSYIENLGNGNFKVSALPPLAQLSNINDILIDDFNGDKHLDALLVGNLFVSEIETPRNDAGVGLLLAGNGNGSFEAIPPMKSGFYARGDAKRISYITIGGKQKILVANNDDKCSIFNVDWYHK